MTFAWFKSLPMPGQTAPRGGAAVGLLSERPALEMGVWCCASGAAAMMAGDRDSLGIHSLAQALSPGSAPRPPTFLH